MISLINITRTYRERNREIRALDHLSITINEGEFLAVTGPSGCGKTTLLNVLGGYDRPQQGLYLIDGEIVTDLSDIRAITGMVFQDFQLLPYLNVRENVMLPLHMKGIKCDDRRLDWVMKQVGLSDYRLSYPHQLSGGQKQRTAIARVLMSQARIILADEPTGALDKDNAVKIVELLSGLKRKGMTVIMVTHDEHLAFQADRCIRMERGQVVS